MSNTKKATRKKVVETNRFDANRLTYPYSIMLPQSFGELLKEAAPKGVPVSNCYGRLYVEVTDPATMEKLVGGLLRSKDKTLSETVINGVIGSMR